MRRTLASGDRRIRQRFKGSILCLLGAMGTGTYNRYSRLLHRNADLGMSGMRRTVDGYHVGSALTDDGVLASDHRPIFADITLL